ncbi:hypothetical protein HMF8227_02318 [Saliniradius amylolyticus]|uniref:Copper-binding protein MbnP-like domain-containing protein n=1 Tax=Saliniradius amylolyticus TaxID=2183582 RepID=A0A2S2E538_9ALTE|nr:MbnP family protein [Saliniradius amylolyticus]AWL12771.1 hypothetical protein HMF8227_02318 [Saliniradius amylolyticus]
MALRCVMAVLLLIFLSACHPWQKSNVLPAQLWFEGKALRCEQAILINGKKWHLQHAQLFLTDFRDQDGNPLPLKPGLWQSEHTALLTLEKLGCLLDKQTPANRNVVFAESVNWQELKQLHFTVGVIPEENQHHPRVQPSPLDLAGMIYSEEGGHRYARVDLLSVADHWSYTLGCPMPHETSELCPEGGPVRYQLAVSEDSDVLIFHLDQLVKGLKTSRRHSCSRDLRYEATCQRGRQNLANGAFTLEED